MDQSPEALLQFKNHSDRTGYRNCAECQGNRRRKVAWREQTKTREQQGQPKDQKSDKSLGCSLSDLLSQ